MAEEHLPDLRFVTNKELIDELRSRCNAFALVYAPKAIPPEDIEAGVTFYVSRGDNYNWSLGLARRLWKIMDEQEPPEISNGDEDDQDPSDTEPV